MMKSVSGTQLIEKINRRFNEADAALILRAYSFSNERTMAFDSSYCKAASLLIDQGADATTIISALLAALLWEGCIDSDEVLTFFGHAVYDTLNDLNPLPVPLNAEEHQRRKDIPALFTSIGGMPRKAILLIAYRLLALEDAIDSGKMDFQKIAQETLDLFVPIASRLGLSDLRRRLEDVCFHIIDPLGYDRLRKKVDPIQAEDNKCLQILLTGVQRLLDNNNIQGRVQGRTKSLQGIRRKMIRTGNTLEKIMDRVGLRIIVTSVPECYKVLGLLHTHFKPIPGTFDDYIGLPKDNGYQSLHTCVYPVREITQKPIEFQVRTELMHTEAEHGVAAHWRYKFESNIPKVDRDQSQWMEGIVRQYEEAKSTEAFIDRLHRQVFQDNLVVFGNHGRIVRLAEKSNVTDYIKITNVYVPKGAVVKVNGKVAAMDSPLRNGDSIEILTTGIPVNSNVSEATRQKTFSGIGMP